MSNRAHDKLMEQEYYHNEYSCCDCGYKRGCGHHPLIRCTLTGRCGECGNKWPCEDHIDLVPEEKRKWLLENPMFGQAADYILVG